jgi:copper resistance protein B
MDHGSMDHGSMDHGSMDHGSMDHGSMDHGSMDHGSMDHGSMDHGSMDHGKSWAMSAEIMPPKGGDQDAMQNMKMGPMQGGSPPPDARDPDTYAEGTRKHAMPGMDMADNDLYGRMLINELEFSDGRREHGQSLDAEAWYGGDYHKLWLKAEGERRDGRLESLRTEALWDRVFATFWSTQLGVRHDTGGGASRNWLAFGVQGLAPYWFETTATAYASSGGMLAARGEVRYELLLTQRLILEPKLEANLYSKDDPARGIGSGLSDASFGLRLRYEIRRQFAPYIGVSWNGKFGRTADFARAAGERVSDTQAVAGVRIWF